MPIPVSVSPELVTLRVFAGRIRAAWDSGGHITRADVKAALDDMEA